MVLYENERHDNEADERDDQALSDTHTLEASHEVLKRTLGDKLDGEDIHDRDATGIDTHLSGTEERVIEDEIETGNSKEHKQQPCSCTHDALRANGHNSWAKDDHS